MGALKNMLGVITIVLILMALFTPAVAQTTVTKKSIQDMYIQFLASEGYQPRLDADGDVMFKREGKTYFLKVSNNDPMFFTLVFPGFWPIESKEERILVYGAADFSNGISKVCKINTVKDDVWAAIELFIPSPESFKSVFQRSLGALDNGVTNFVVGMRVMKLSLPVPSAKPAKTFH